jgi:LuxR family maltose regulon positive regulatory protein
LVKLSLARRRGHLAGVLELVEFLDAPLTGQSEEDIALGNDLRAAALMNLGIVEAWSLGVPDGERHLLEGALLARKIGRPFLEVSCLAELGFASKFRSFATVRSRCAEAVALADRHGWGMEPMISPALVTLASIMIWTGAFDEGERWLRRTEQALQSDAGPPMRLLLHIVTGMLYAGRGHHREALDEFTAALQMQSWLGPNTLVSMVTSWTLATQARLGMPDAARAALATIPDELAGSGEVHNARAVIGLADGDPQAALDALHDVLDRTAPVIGDITVIEAHLLAALAHHLLGDQPATNRSVERAMALAEPDGLVLPFAMTGARPLLEALPRHETAHAALLIAILDVAHGSSPTAHDVPSSSTPTEELSPSELRVLRYLPTNLSRPEIAGELSVSVNTVNTHLRNIYAKLQTSNRSSTVRRARELRLLSAVVPDGPALTAARTTPSRLSRRSAR